MMFAGKFVDSPACRRVGDVKASLCKRAGGPNVDESTATSVGDPQAGILAVPTPVDVGISCVRIVVNLLPNFASLLGSGTRLHGAVTTEEADVVDHRIAAGHPLCGHGTRIDAIGVETDASEDVCAALRRFQQRLWAANTLECGCAVGDQDARDAGMQTDENRVRLECDGIRDE